MFELFLIKTVIGQVSLFLACLSLVMFLHHFIPFNHILKKSVKLYLTFGAITFVIRMIGNLEKVYWMAKAARFFM